MKMIISPAKSLNFEKKLPTSQTTQPMFLSEAERINKLLKKKSVKGLEKLMGISENLSQLNWNATKLFSCLLHQKTHAPRSILLMVMCILDLMCIAYLLIK